MVIKSLLFFVLLFGAYTLFLRLHKVKWHSNQNQYQQNIIKADRYIYSDTLPEAAILGTSLSERIVEDSIPGACNLAMAGLSVFDGFHVLFKPKQLPHCVFIETNILYKAQDDAFVQIYDSEIEVFLKNHFSAIRDENQPVGIFKHYIEMYAKKKPGKIGPATHQDVSLPGSLFNELLSNKEREYLHPDTVLIKSGLSKLIGDVEKLEKRSVKVFFFEMPTDARLEHLPLAIYTRQLIKQNFPQIPVLQIPTDNFRTTDGFHLQPSSATIYSHYFKSYMQKMMRS